MESAAQTPEPSVENEPTNADLLRHMFHSHRGHPKRMESRVTSHEKRFDMMDGAMQALNERVEYFELMGAGSGGEVLKKKKKRNEMTRCMRGELQGVSVKVTEVAKRQQKQEIAATATAPAASSSSPSQLVAFPDNPGIIGGLGRDTPCGQTQQHAFF